MYLKSRQNTTQAIENKGGVFMNVAEGYVRLARDLREGTSSCPSFDDAVVRHTMLEGVPHASEKAIWQCL